MQKKEIEVGLMGFYRPDPSGPKSPIVIRAIEGKTLRVRTLRSRYDLEIDADEWMSFADMKAETMKLTASTDDIDQRRVAERIDALAWLGDYLQRIVRARGITRGAGYRVEQGNDGEFEGKWWWTLIRPGWASVEVSHEEFDSEDDAWLDALRALEEEVAELAA